MAELNTHEEKVLQALKDLGADSEEKMKPVEIIEKKANIPKNFVSNALISLKDKKLVRRVAREKVAGYYYLPQQNP